MAGAIETVDRKQIAAMLGVKLRYVTDDLSKRPGFPKPIYQLSQRLVRWALKDVLEWMKTETRKHA